MQSLTALDDQLRPVATRVIETVRVRTFKNPDGLIFLALPVVGVAEFRDGKITTWREYYDSAAVPGLNR